MLVKCGNAREGTLREARREWGGLGVRRKGVVGSALHWSVLAGVFMWACVGRAGERCCEGAWLRGGEAEGGDWKARSRCVMYFRNHMEPYGLSVTPVAAVDGGGGKLTSECYGPFARSRGRGVARFSRAFSFRCLRARRPH